MTAEQEILWLAGLLEGEGCFYYRKMHKDHRTSAIYGIAVNMTDRDVIERAARIMGITHIGVRKRQPVKKDVFVIQISGVRGVAIMRLVLPFMGQRRAAKIEEIIRLYETRVTPQVAIAESNRRRAKQKRLFAVA